MKTFKQVYLAEKKAATREQASEFRNQIQRAIQPDMIDKLSQYGDWYDISIRAYDFFTERPGEEDDDHPNFTGDKRLNKILKSIFKGFEFEFWPEEKSWITIRVKAKPLSKKQQKADLKKKIDPVRNSVRNEAWKADSIWERAFWNDFKEILAKYKKKFITKEEYFKLARSAKHGDDEIAEEAWLLAK
jgi:hypothetical protein